MGVEALADVMLLYHGYQPGHLQGVKQGLCLAGCMLPTPGSAAQTLKGAYVGSLHPRYHWSCAASPPTKASLSLLLAVCTAAVAFPSRIRHLAVLDGFWRCRRVAKHVRETHVAAVAFPSTWNGACALMPRHSKWGGVARSSANTPPFMSIRAISLKTNQKKSAAT